VIVTVPAPPRAGTGVSGAPTETAHFETADGEVMEVVVDEPQPRIPKPAKVAATSRAVRIRDAARAGR
jgi:hypothetical protein